MDRAAASTHGGAARTARQGSRARPSAARNHCRRNAARSAVPRVSSQSPGRRMTELTHVELLWIRKQVENRIRFGRIVNQHIIDRQWRVVSFEAGSIFAFVRWAGNDYGTTVSRI